MEIQNPSVFISEVSAMMRDPRYREFIDLMEKKSVTKKEEVFQKYFGNERYYENQMYNDKNATVEKMKAYIETKDIAIAILPPEGSKYIAEFLTDLLIQWEQQIKNAIGWMSWLTMSIYTESDLDLFVAGVYFAASKFYEEEIEKLKKPKDEDGVFYDPDAQKEE